MQIILIVYGFTVDRKKLERIVNLQVYLIIVVLNLYIP